MRKAIRDKSSLAPSIRQIVMGNLAAALLAVALTACAQAPQTAERQATQARMTDGKTLFNEKCATVAGEKIYRKVENVEGVLLMKVRPQAGDTEWANRDWPGAAFARETTGDGFITSFLGYEYPFTTLREASPRPITPKSRGYVSSDLRPGGLPGYRWVEVVDEKDGQRYRYVLVQKPRPTSKIGWIDTVLDKAPSPSPTPPRYGVTYEDHVIPDERYLGVASSTVKVLDLQTKEVLGEMIRYAWSPGAPSRVNPSPWLTAYRCGGMHSSVIDTTTRQFADEILVPAKEK
jgi:hypothetical protein